MEIELLCFQKVAVIAGDAQCSVFIGRVKFDDFVGDILKEVAIVADDYAGERRVQQQAFEPLDAGEVQMIRGLVKKENVWFAHKSFGDGETLCASPPERVPASTSRSVKPARPKISAVRARRSLSGALSWSRALLITERIVSPGANSVIWHTRLRCVPLRIATSPVSGRVAPLRMSRRVDLPEPFGPMTPMRSPSDTTNETFWKSGTTP